MGPCWRAWRASHDGEPGRGRMDSKVKVDLNAVVVAVTDDEPRMLALDGGCVLPSGPLKADHRTLEAGLRDWVETQTNQRLGYVEQLYTFADLDRGADRGDERPVSIGYLALVREARPAGAAEAGWYNWYRYFPWEDWRRGTPAMIAEIILPALRRWVAETE